MEVKRKTSYVQWHEFYSNSGVGTYTPNEYGDEFVIDNVIGYL